MTLRAEAKLPHLNQEYYSDFDNIYPWSGMGRYLVHKDTKAVVSKLDFEDSNREAVTLRKIDWVEMEKTCDVDVQTPIFAFKIEFDANNKIHVDIQTSNPLVSGLKEGYIVHPYFVRPDGTLRGYASVGAFKGCIIDNQLRSLPFKVAAKNATIDTFRTRARQGRDNRSNMITIDAISAFIMLYYVEFASLDSQTKLGKGMTELPGEDINDERVWTGSTLALGDRSGYLGVNGKNSMSYRGIEDLYGHKWDFVDGLFIKDDGYYYCNNPLYFGDISKYTRIAVTPLMGTEPNQHIEGYIAGIEKLSGSTHLFIPNKLSGASNKRYADYFWSHRKGQTNIVLFGGPWADGARCGVLSWYFYGMSSYSSWSFGSRLCFLP